MNIAVYLGSKEGNKPIYKEAILELGTWIGENGHCLVYGGSKHGLMGVLGRTVLEANGKVIGVEPQKFIERGYQLEGLTELIVTKDIRERRAKMIELADMFIAFPGGIGTAEEITEVISAGSLDDIKGLFGYYNVDGYYNLLQEHYDFMVEQGFLATEVREKIKFWNSLEEIARDIEQLENE